MISATGTLRKNTSKVQKKMKSAIKRYYKPTKTGSKSYKSNNNANTKQHNRNGYSARKNTQHSTQHNFNTHSGGKKQILKYNSNPYKAKKLGIVRKK